MQVLYGALETFVTLSLLKINEDDLNKREDYGVSFSEQYTHWVSLFICKSFDQSDLPEWPQILDIYSVVVL